MGKAIESFGALSGEEQVAVTEFLLREVCYRDAPTAFPGFVEQLAKIPAGSVLAAVGLPSRVRLSDEQERALATATLVYGIGLAVESLEERQMPLATPAIFGFLKDAVAKEHAEKGPFDHMASFRLAAVSALTKLTEVKEGD